MIKLKNILNEEDYVFIDADGKEKKISQQDRDDAMANVKAKGGYVLDDDQHEAVQLLLGLIDKKSSSERTKLKKHFSEFMGALFGNKPL